MSNSHWHSALVDTTVLLEIIARPDNNDNKQISGLEDGSYATTNTSCFAKVNSIATDTSTVDSLRTLSSRQAFYYDCWYRIRGKGSSSPSFIERFQFFCRPVVIF